MNEIEWLAERRPETGEPSAPATARARAALLEHAETQPRRRAEIVPRGRRTRARVLVPALAAAVAATVVAGSLPAGEHAPRLPRLAPPAAEAAPLVRLAARIKAAPAPPGDATLVLREHDFPDRKSFTGADLYLDSGRYYYGATLAQLRAGAAADPDESTGGNDAPKAELRAAVEAFTTPPDKAREQMILATGVPASDAHASTRIQNNRVWMGCMDALIAGAGRADVRAGVMKLLATMPEVDVEQGDGILRLRMADVSGYEETLVVDDATGVLREMVGGVHGRRPDVVVRYDVKRVTAAEVLGS